MARQTATGRVVVTQDSDFLRLHADGRAHRGIIYASAHLSVGEMIRGQMLVQDLLTAEEMVNHLEFL